jgi:alcohol dehydrogenase
LSDFIFNSVGSVLVEDGAASRLGEILSEHYAAQRILLITDPGLLKLGLVDKALSSMKASRLEIVVFSDVEADPSEETVMKATAVAQDCSAELIVGFGGGSSMDVAKLVAVLAPGIQPLSAMFGVGQVQERGLLLVQVPTTAGTGSEVTAVSIITTGENSKMGVVSPHIMADLAILDAELTMGLPSHITAATGIDAMVHAIEAYTSAIKKNPVSDALARQALTLLGDNVVTACKDGSNLDARRGMLTGAMMAGASFANAPVGAVHALAYPLGGRFHIPHGLSNSLVLPHVLKFNAKKASSLYGELADLMGLGGTSDDAKTSAFIEWLESVAEEVGIERKLREMKIKESDLQVLAEDAMLQTRLLVNNPREVTCDDALKIYEAAW